MDTTAPVPPTPISRAGRNLPAAIAVGVALGGVVLASLFVVREVFLVVVLAAAGLAVHELATALRTRGIVVPLVPVYVGGAAMLVGAHLGGSDALLAGMALTWVGVVVFRLVRGADGFVRDASAGVFVTGYVPLLGGFVVLLLGPDDGAWRIVVFVVTTISSDIAGYAAGALFGRHAMAPVISPKKSWEGFAGSVAGCMLAGWLTVTFGLGGPAWVGVLLGVVVAVTATVGDLCESVVKRDLGIKDMGTLLPGHGGIMDRLDSLLVVAPVCWLVLHLVPVG